MMDLIDVADGLLRVLLCADTGYLTEHVDVLQGLVYFFMQSPGDIAPHALHGFFFLHTLAIQPVEEDRRHQQQESQEPPGTPEGASYKDVNFFDMGTGRVLCIAGVDAKGIAAWGEIVIYRLVRSG